MDVFRRVPCGECVVCQQQKQTEWALRAYYEFLDTERNNGFAYWDTLTYENHQIPTSYGFYCFSRKDVQDFLKRLRILLARHFGIERNAFKYLVVSEYGEARHRCHYHIILFMHTKSITPALLQWALNTTWIKGENGNMRQLEEGKKQSCQDFVITNQSGLNYVTKYIAKDQFWTKKNIERVISEIVSNNVYPPQGFTLHHDYEEHFSHVTMDEFEKFKFPNLKTWSLDNLDVEMVDGKCVKTLSMRKIRRDFQPFHLSSINFGAYLLEHPDLDSINETAPMPTDTNIKKAIDLPLYYRRKLFYHCVEIDGKLAWFPNDDYLPKLYEKELKAIDNDAIQIGNRLSSLDSLVTLPDIKVKALDLLPAGYRTFNEYINFLLDGRSTRDLAIYNRYYRGRMSIDGIYESVYDIIMRRLDKSLFGVMENPLMVDDDALRRSNRICARSVALNELDSSLWRNFDIINDITDKIFSFYSSYSIIREIENRGNKKKLKKGTYKNLLF